MKMLQVRDGANIKIEELKRVNTASKTKTSM